MSETEAAHSADLAFGTTVAESITMLEAEGHLGSFRVAGPNTIECLTCRRTQKAVDVTLDRLVRVEGVSDPADEEAVMGLTCAHCDTKGTLVLAYGTNASAEEAEVLLRLKDERRDGPRDPMRPAGKHSARRTSQKQTTL